MSTTNRKIFNITVTDSVASFLLRQGRIVCGNDKYRIRFTFDSEWDGQDQKVARFNFAGKHTDVPFTGNEVDVPVISGATEVEVGVYTEDGPFTTTGAVIPCELSILCKPSASSPENDKRYLDEARRLVQEARDILEQMGNVEGLEGLDELLAGKLDKVTDAGNALRAYTIDKDGSQKMLEVTYGVTNTYGMIAGKLAGGIVPVGNPTGATHAVPLGFADGRYLAIQPSQGTNAAYGIRPNGEQAMFLMSANNPTVFSMPLRDDGLTFEVGEPTKAKHPATRGFVESGFVPKQAVLPNGAWGVYTCKDDGSTTLLAATTGLGGSIPMRGANGVVTVGEPAASNHAVTLGFADGRYMKKTDAASGKRTIINWKEDIESQYWYDDEWEEANRGTYEFKPGRYDVYLSTDSDIYRGIATFEGFGFVDSDADMPKIVVAGDTNAVSVSRCDWSDHYGRPVMSFNTTGNMGEHFLLDIDELISGSDKGLYIYVKHIELNPEG